MATPNISSVGGDAYTLGHRALNNAGMDETGSGVEGRAARTFQRSISEKNLPGRRPDSSDSARQNYEAKPLFGHQRRQLTRDPKAPPTAAALQSSPSKRQVHLVIGDRSPIWLTDFRRFAYDASINRFASQPAVPSIGQANSHARQTSINSTSRFSLASSAPSTKKDSVDTTGSYDFLPPVNFDDLQASLKREEPNRRAFPVAGIGKRVLSGNHNDDDTDYVKLKSSPRKSTVAGIGSTMAYESFLRRQNSITRQGNDSIGHQNTMVPSGTAVNTKARRQSYFPVPSGNLPMHRQPRKSVGPGVLPSDFAGQLGQKRINGQVQQSTEEGRGFIHPSADTDENVFGAHFHALTNGPSSIGNTRSTKAKSLLPPPRLITDQFSTPSGSPDQTMSLFPGSARSPARNLPPSSGTPSSDKRLSMMPNSAHATGLAARTISPTDARRLKRMSMMPNPPAMPFAPQTPQPDTPTSGTGNSAPSPILIPRKSITPSSSRTTPDHNRKSYSSGISNSSSTSYNSLGNSTGPARISQSLSTSRLPTLKTRIDGASAAGEGEVPPVPAIPKAYESPKTEFDQPFFSMRKSSLPFETSSTTSGSNNEGAISGIAERDLPKPDGGLQWKDFRFDSHPATEKPGTSGSELPISEGGRQRRGRTVDEYPGTGKKANGGININRRTLQPLRMPPLNLLPLSTPTAAKIAALYDGAGSTDLGSITPPPKKGQHSSPSTPMTASKASFSRSYRDEDPVPQLPHLRSNSSHHTTRPDSSVYRAPSSSSSHIPIASERIEANSTRKAISPFNSMSLPKTSGDFGYMRPASSGFYDQNGPTGNRQAKLTGPRLQKARKGSKDDASSIEASSPAEGNGQSFGNSLRRKLSLTRKRSVSKSQSRTDIHTDFEAPPKPPKHDNMPPPKLPASATWNGPLMPSPSPTQKHTAFQAREKASNMMADYTLERMRSNTWTMNGVPRKEATPTSAVATPTSKRTLRTQLERGHAQSSLSLKEFLTEAKESPLDRDDLTAEEEMRRLASKRNDSEKSAKELDVLRRRATAKERVSPSHALRVVNLNIFERGEIVDYKDIYFCGTQDAQKHVGDLTAEALNFGYDDDRGDYKILPGDHLAYRYEIVDILGKGSFGQVVRCVDHRSGSLVAIKIIRNKKRFHQQALVEVDILQKLKEWDPRSKHSMVTFVQSFYFRGHLCISTELLSMNLYEFIKCHDFRGFSLKIIRRFAKQLLSSLILLKTHKVIHCDLKPENILLAHPARSEIKVIDFGSSCLENEKVYTYIQSRFYRSPEVILGMQYGMPIDMWSVGCILAELLTGYPIFPGENEQEQLACIMEVFGPPEKHLIEKSTRKKLFFDSLGKPRLTVSSKGKRRRPSSKNLQQALKCEDEAFLDFVTRCLRWDPDRRLKPDEAMRHEFITGIKPSAKPLRPPIPTSNSSPLKRNNSTYKAAAGRPLPEPPAANAKIGPAARTKEVMSSSPIKATMPPKRHSTVNGLQTNVGVKRTVNGAAINGSALPRVAPRATSGKPDMAAAAAMASLQKSR